MAMNPQVALVTDASQGIGPGIAIELARLGFSVAINFARSREATLECKRLCEQAALTSAHAALKGGATPSFEVCLADISKAAGGAGLLQAVQERFGWIDLLVNNAGHFD